jgi:hypothetical protein
MEIEIKNYSKLYLRRTLRSILPQRKCSKGIIIIPNCGWRSLVDGFGQIFRFCMKSFANGNGEIIASKHFIKEYFCEFFTEEQMFRDHLVVIYKCILLFFPEVVDKIISIFIRESYKNDDTLILTDFTDCVDTILPHKKLQ